jgi:hypothetical protein
MAEPGTVTEYTVELPRPTLTKWEREYQAFLRMLPELLRTHPARYAAVHEEKVVDVGDDKMDLAGRMYEKYGYIPIYVGLVAARPLPPVRMPSIREVTRGK